MMLLSTVMALGIAAQSSHLVPRSDQAKLYDFVVSMHIAPMSRSLPVVEMVCMPSQTPEIGVFLIEEPGKDGTAHAEIVVVEAPLSLGQLPALYTGELRARLAAVAALDIKVTTLRAPIDGDTVMRLRELWGAALSRVRHPAHVETLLDATTCTFADNDEAVGRRTGSTSTTVTPSAMYSLRAVGYELADYAQQSPEKRAWSRDRIRGITAVARGWFSATPWSASAPSTK